MKNPPPRSKQVNFRTGHGSAPRSCAFLLRLAYVRWPAQPVRRWMPGSSGRARSTDLSFHNPGRQLPRSSLTLFLAANPARRRSWSRSVRLRPVQAALQSGPGSGAGVRRFERHRRLCFFQAWREGLEDRICPQSKSPQTSPSPYRGTRRRSFPHRSHCRSSDGSARETHANPAFWQAPA